MHYHLEIVMPPTDDVDAAVKEILAPFDENDGTDRSHAFWDYWVIGGRWGGAKLMAAFEQTRLDEFYARLKDAKVTVSGLQFGKQTLSPGGQEETVDRLWNETFPESPVKVCPVFDNYKGSYGDVMRLGDYPAALTCVHVIVAALDYKGEKLEAVFMCRDSIWNGVMHQDTRWDKTLSGALRDNTEKMKHYQPEYAARRTPDDDWLVVTVDYHS